MDFWMVWVAGARIPKRIHPTKESAVTEAERLRREVTQREVYVLEPVHRVDGRKLLSVKPSKSLQKQEIEPDPKG
jgi:hypothetical protein